MLPSAMAIVPKLSGPDPTFVIVTGTTLLLVPVATLPKLILLVLKLATGTVLPPGVRKATICMIHWPDALRGAEAL